MIAFKIIQHFRVSILKMACGPYSTYIFFQSLNSIRKSQNKSLPLAGSNEKCFFKMTNTWGVSGGQHDVQSVTWLSLSLLGKIVEDEWLKWKEKLFSFILKTPLCMSLIFDLEYLYLCLLSISFHILHTVLLFICFYTTYCTQNIFSEISFMKTLKLKSVMLWCPSWKMYLYIYKYIYLYICLLCHMWLICHFTAVIIWGTIWKEKYGLFFFSLER